MRLIATITISSALMALTVLLALNSLQKLQLERFSQRKSADYDPNDLVFPVGKLQQYDFSRTHTIPLRFWTNETTWTHLDVSPDGRKIVFDVLGDLYIVGIDGGAARPLTRGVQIDKQASFSPSGKRVAYISDASGCDAVYVLDLESGKRTRVTGYEWQIMRLPVWLSETEILAVYGESGLGRFLMARFVVPEHGQKPLPGNFVFSSKVELFEEPSALLSSSFIFYSQGNRKYEADPYKEPHTVWRMSLYDGDRTLITNGARPVVSADGSLLAFVRRDFFQTVLVLREIRTGKETVLFRDLDHDATTSYKRMFGTYPAFSFLPKDTKKPPTDVVFWAQGKIKRLNLVTNEVIDIPISVPVDIKLAPVVRARGIQMGLDYSEKGDASFRIKTVDRVEVKEVSGMRLVYFRALGSTWKRKLDAIPRVASEVTEDDLHASSQDGLLSVSWENSDKASLLQVRRSTGKMLEQQSVHATYLPFEVSRAFPAANGRKILVSVPPSGSVPKPIGLPNESYLTRNSARVAEVDINSMKVSYGYVHAPEASYIIQSPDEKYVAFVEFYEIYVAKYDDLPDYRGMKIVQARRRNEKSSKSVTRISQNGGNEPFFSNDSKSVFFTLGSTLHEINMERIWECQEGSNFDENCVAKSTTKFDLGWQFNVSRREGSAYTIVSNASIITMNDKDQVIYSGDILLKHNKIVKVGRSVEVPAGSKIIDAQGGFVVPGYLDVHAHTIISDEDWVYTAALAFGVTTSFDPSSDQEYIFQRAERVKAGRLISPRIFSTGKVMVGFGDSYYHQPVLNYQDALDAVRRQKAVGANSIKSYMQQCRASANMLIDAAKEEGLSNVPEGGMAWYFNLGYAIDGHTTLEHTLPVSAIYSDVRTLFAKSETAYNPTLTVAYGDLFGKTYWLAEYNIYDNDKFLNFVPRDILTMLSVFRRQKADVKRDYAFVNSSKSAHDILTAGGVVNTGSHGEIPGIGLIWEMWMLEQGGFSPYEVLKAATRNPAKTHNMFHAVGSIEEGKLADLLIYPPGFDLLNDLSRADRMSYVIADGVVYDAETMSKL